VLAGTKNLEGMIYTSVFGKNGTWSKARNMGNRINTSNHELWPSVSSDGKYIFFMSFRTGNADVYWINAKIIDTLKLEEKWANPSNTKP
jgi:Tol biopolymer transport system component